MLMLMLTHARRRAPAGRASMAGNVFGRMLGANRCMYVMTAPSSRRVGCRSRQLLFTQLGLHHKLVD